MNKELLFKIFFPALIAGLFLGIYLRTGTDISKEALTIDTGDKITWTLGGKAVDWWKTAREGILFVSVVITIYDIILIIKSGWWPRLTAAIGYTGGLILIATPKPIIGLILLIVGVIVCKIAPKELSIPRLIT